MSLTLREIKLSKQRRKNRDRHAVLILSESWLQACWLLADSTVQYHGISTECRFERGDLKLKWKFRALSGHTTFMCSFPDIVGFLWTSKFKSTHDTCKSIFCTLNFVKTGQLFCEGTFSISVPYLDTHWYKGKDKVKAIFFWRALVRPFKIYGTSLLS